MVNSYDLEIIHYALIKLYNDCVELEGNGFKSIFPFDHIDDVTDDIELLQAQLNSSKSNYVTFVIEKEDPE